MHMAEWHGTLVAAKIIKDSSAIALEDFRSELDVLRRVHHPNAVQFLGACTKREPFILVSGAAPSPAHYSDVDVCQAPDDPHQRSQSDALSI